MTQQLPFYIKSGIPFGKTVTVTLPSGRTYWTDDTEFEVICQIREAPDSESTLLLDITDNLTIDFTAPDTVEISLSLTGADTRLLKDDGFYDMIMSDPFTEDARAVTLVEGPVYRTTVVTSDAKVV